MEMTGEQIIALPQADVWRGLNDPEILKQSIPGCDSVERVSDTEYKVAMTAAVGPVKAKFAGKMTLSDLNPPNSYSIAFEGSGGAAGFAKGSAAVTLAPEGSGTKLSYTAKANIGGKLAQVGARLIDGVAKKQAEDFFNRFNAVMAPAAAPEATSAASPARGAPKAEEPEPFNPLWLVGGTLLAMLVVHWLLGPAKYIS